MIPPSDSRKSLFPGKFLASLFLLAFFSGATLAANVIKGSVRNQTRRQPAANDDVLLLRLDSSTPEESRTKTDAEGAFSIDVKDPTKPYLLRVIHQGVAYDQKAIPGDSVDLQVFDSSPTVPGLSGSIEILRAGTTGTMLHISDMYEVRNDSNPPLTRTGDRTFSSHGQI